MEKKNLDLSLELFGELLIGSTVSALEGRNTALYNAYHENAEVYEMVEKMLKNLGLKLYEYKNSLYISAGENNRVFGYSNDEMKRVLNLKLNRELYLVYFLMYQVVIHFYNDSSTYTYAEYIRIEDIISNTDAAFKRLVENGNFVLKNELEEKSIELLAITWDELPVILNEEVTGIRAGRSSKSALVKLALNFLVSQDLMVVAEEKYYPTDRFHALIDGYFEDNQSRLYEIAREIVK